MQLQMQRVPSALKLKEGLPGSPLIAEARDPDPLCLVASALASIKLTLPTRKQLAADPARGAKLNAEEGRVTATLEGIVR